MAKFKSHKEKVEEEARRYKRGLATKPKKTNVLTKNKDSVNNHIVEREQRLVNKVGSPFKSDAQITYTNDKFNKRKKTKDGGNFEWDGKMLKGLSNKKYGKSYAAKFESLANEAGIPHNQRGAFKDYLDAKEYKANPNARQDDANFNNDRRVDKLMKKNEREKATQKVEVKKSDTKKEARDKIKSGYDVRKDWHKESIDRIVPYTIFGQDSYKEELEKKEKEGYKQSGFERGASRAVNALSSGIPQQLEKAGTGKTPEYATKRDFGDGGGTDVISDLLGYLAPGAGVTKGLRLLDKGADLSKGVFTGAGIATRAKEGATVGALMSGAEVGSREALNPDDYNWKQNLGQIALETAGGAALDPLVSMLGAGVKAGANRTVQNAISTTNEDLVSRMMQGVGDIQRMPSPLDNMAPQNPLDDLIKRSQAQQVQTPRLDAPDRSQGDQALADYTRQYEETQGLAQQTRQNNVNPLGLTDYEPNFTLRDPNQLRLEAPKSENYPTVYRPDSPLEEKLAYWKNPEMARTESDVREMFKEMENIETSIKQFDDGFDDMVRAKASETNPPKMMEMTYINSKNGIEQHLEAEDLWKAAKEVKEQFADPSKRPEWAKFSVPPELRMQDEFKDIPTRFIAKGKDVNHGTDYAKAMDLAGYGYFDEFVEHLRFIDSQLTATRKGLGVVDAKTRKSYETDLATTRSALEEQYREELGISDMERQLDELSELAVPYDPPVETPVSFKTTQRTEVPRDPITEILYPNAQYGVERAALNSPRSESAATTAVNETPTRTESLSIEQAPRDTTAPEPKMVRAKQQEALQVQAMDVVTTQSEALKTIISKGTKESEQNAKRIIDVATKSPSMKVFRKFRQSMVGSKNSATYAERHLLKKEIPKVQERLKAATTDGEKSSVQYELDELNRRLKASKDTSYTQMALENETGADIKAHTISNDFVKKLSSVPDTTIAEASNWQLAQRLNWLMKGDETQGVQPRSIPEAWAKWTEDILATDKPAFRQTEQVFREMQELRMNELMKSGQKSPEEIERLLREPYYVPAYIDDSYKIAKGAESGKSLKGSPNGQRNTSSDITTIKSFGSDGSAGNPVMFVNNPVESIIDDVFREQRSIARNDSAQQFRKLGQMDDLGTFVKEIDEKTYKLNGGDENIAYLKGYENGEPFYLQIHDDFRAMLKENDNIEKVDPIQLATTVMSRLKTTSPEYLMTAIPRDLATSFMNTENPVKYAAGLWKSLTDEAYRSTGYDAGVQFRNAYDPQSAAIQGAEQLKKEIKEMAGFTDVDATNVEKATGLVSKLWDKTTKPLTAIGQFSDDVPRIIEANIVKDRWETKILSQTRAKIEDATKRLETAPKEDFVDGNVSQVQGELEALNERLAMEIKGMEREMTHRGRDVMPYQRSGSSFLAKGFKKYVNFANTTTQSKDKLARTFARDPVGTLIKGTALAAPMGLLVSQGYDALSPEDKEKYDAIPDYMKQQRYVIPLGGEKYISVPKVQELAILSNQADAMAGTMSWEAALTYAGKEITPAQLGGVTQGLIGGSFEQGQKNKDGDLKEGTDGLTLSNFQKNATIPGTLVSPLMDTMFNTKTSFNGKPVSYNREGEADEWTMDLFTHMLGNNDWANAAQYNTLQYGGDYAKYLTNALNMMITPRTGGSTSERETQNDLDGRRALNPLQDYNYNPQSELFKEMFYNKDKLKK